MEDLTFWEMAMWTKFNPSNDWDVDTVKEKCAQLANQLNDLREKAWHWEAWRMLSVAITELQTAQMRAVKAITWKY